MKRFLVAALMWPLVALAQQVYTTDCVANSNCTNAGHIGNAARSLWVDPAGIAITSSNWDENNGSVQIYQAGVSTGSLLSHGGGSGSAIAGNATYLWVPCQFNSHAAAGQQNGCVQRVLRASPNMVDIVYNVSVNTTERYKDLIGGLAQWGQFWAASDIAGNRVMVYNTSDVFQNSFPVTNPGALAFDRNGNLWVASGNTITDYARSTGTALQTITLPTGSNVTALYYDPSTTNLYVGDSGPDEQIKIFSSAGVQVGTFGDLGGYRNTTTGIMGQGGATRFMQIAGIGKDSAGNLYVLNQPWGHNFDLGRTGGTDLHVFTKAGALAWRVEGYNFEGIGAPNADASLFYSGQNIYSLTGYVANTVDPFAYPSDPRLVTDTTVYAGRGIGFGQLADVGGNKILVAVDQNPDTAFAFHFAPNSYIAIPDGTPFQPVGSRIRAGFWLDTQGGAWASYDRPANLIYHYPLIGFDASGKPSWSAPVQYTVPATMTGQLARIIYLPDSDTMILANKLGTDWTAIGTRVEVYHNWTTNQTNPLVINLTSTNPKSIAAAGNYLFVGYVHTVPNVDAFDLTTGTLKTTFTSSNPNVYVGNDVDSMYGIRAAILPTGQYVVTKDDYNGNSIVVYRWTPQ